MYRQPDGRRGIRREMLLGVTVGCYVTAAINLTSFGGILVVVQDDTRWQLPSVAQPPFLLLLIPGIIIGLLSFLQIYSEGLFKRKANVRTTSVALWLNAIGAVGWCLAWPLTSLKDELPNGAFLILGLICVGIMMGLCTVIGISLSIFNLSTNLLWAWRARRRLVTPL